MTGGRAFDCRVHGSIDEIDPAEWDSVLAPDDVQATHRFVRACQQSGVEGADYRFVVIHEGGHPGAVAALSRMTVSLDLLAPPGLRRVLGRLRRALPTLLRVPVVFCGLPVSFGASCLRFGAGADRERAVDAVARQAERFAAETGTSILCFKEFPDAELEALGPLMRHGYFRAPSLPSCALPIHWDTPAAWVADMRAPYRRQLTLDARAAEEAALAARPLGDLEAGAATLFRLYEDVWERAENKLERLNAEFFRQLPANLRDEAWGFSLEREGRVVAAAILLSLGRTTTFLLAGVDSAAGRAGHPYQNLVRRVVEDAISRGAARLELGQTSYEMKGRLGASFSPRWLFLKHRVPWKNFLFRNASKVLFPAVRPRARRVFRSCA